MRYLVRYRVRHQTGMPPTAMHQPMRLLRQQRHRPR
jgi:hypothetical protein